MKDAANEVRAAAAQLKQDGATSIMLDLRDNPGGLLTEAVNIVGIFVERGQLVTTMRGRVREWDKQFRSEHAPLDTKMPLVVLVNSGSASASEIVSGALQDLDRAVIMGQRSFGKGLVQNTVPLVYGSLFKVTIAKYYIPSGRCVQSLDYSHRNPDGTVKRMNDSLITPFKTRNGRAVWDGLGIIPDMELDHPKYSTLTDTLEQSGVMFKFASQYVKQHATIAPADQFRLTDAEYNDFIQFAKSQKVQYITPEERHLKSFKENAEQSGTFASGATEFAALDKKVQDEKSDDYIQYKTEIKALLEQEISGRYYFRTGRLANGFTTDREVLAGITLLSDLARYNSILTTVVDAPKPKQRADLERR
jgi:carboxyl-terminal processing protease